MRDSSSPEAPPNDSLDEFVRNSPGQPRDLTPGRFVELSLGLRWGAESWPGIWKPMTKLNNRFDQLWYLLVEQLREPTPWLNRLSFPEGAHMRASPIVDHYWLYSAEILGNPLLSPECLRKLLEPQPVHGAPVNQWPSAQMAYEVQERGQAERRRSEEEWRRMENKKHVTLAMMGSLDYRVLREARKPPEKRKDSALAYELPRNFDEFLALVEAAFGEAVQPSMDPAFAGVTQPEAGTRPEPQSRYSTASFPRRRESMSLPPKPIPVHLRLRPRSASWRNCFGTPPLCPSAAPRKKPAAWPSTSLTTPLGSPAITRRT